MNIKDLLGKLTSVDGCVVEKANKSWYTISYNNQIWEVKPPNLINVVKSDFLSKENYYMDLDLFYRRCITRELHSEIKRNSFKVWGLGDKLLIKKLVSGNKTINQIADALGREVNPRLITEVCSCTDHSLSKHPCKEIPFEDHDVPIQDLISKIQEKMKSQLIRDYDPLDAVNL